MKQREITDAKNTRWTCVQAFSMLEQKASEKATALSKTEDGKVTIVCTPDGGAKSVRLTLLPTWEELKDEELLAAISEAAD